jgi:hypothetical protein
MFAGIKGYAGDASQPQQVGDLVFYTRRTGSDANLTATMRLNQDGNVNLAHSLTLNGAINMGNDKYISGVNSTGGIEFAFWPRSNNTTYLNYGSAGFAIRNNSSTTTMFMTNTGRVGIGTTSPGFPLHVAGSVGRFIDMNNSVSNNNSTTAPQVGNADVFTAGGAKGANDIGGSPTWNTSIFSEHVVVASAFAAISDRRIKDILAKSSARGDLDLINQLQVTDYRMKDRIGSGSALQKGFIAQEVRKVIPEAVSASRNYLPDIYLPTTENLHDAAQKRLTMTLAKPHALAVGDWVRVYGDETQMETEVLAVLSPTAFVVASEKPVAKAFVYGRRVDDFLTVDYDRIFTTGIGAIQELDHKLKDESAEVTQLQNKVADLEGKLAAQVQRATTQSAGDAAEKAALQARVEAFEARDKIREAKQVAQQAEQITKLAALEAKLAEQEKRATAQADADAALDARIIALQKLINRSRASETVSIKLGDQ